MSQTKIVLNRQSDLILDNAQITSPVGIVVADIDGLQSVIVSIDTQASVDISAEISNRVAGDNSLATNLSIEVDSRIASINAEESRAMVAETSLQNNVDAEASLRLVGDESVAAALSVADASIDATLSTEIARAESAEASLNTKVDLVISNVDPAALDSLTEIVGAFQSADGDLNGAITSLATAATTALDSEASIRLAADQSIAGDLSSEIADREAAVSLEEAARISGDESVNADLSLEVANRESAVSAEQSSRVAGDQSLASDLSTEVVDRTNAVSTEVSSRVAADNSIAVNLSTEVQRAQSSESSLQEAINNEFDRAFLRENFLQSDIENEASRAQSAESSLESKINTDLSNADASIDLALSAEASARVAGDASLAIDFSNLMDAEASYRVAGDLSLQNQIDFIVSNVDPAAIDSLTEIVSAFQSADGDINNAITTLADAAAASLSVEVARATSAEASLASDLSAEVSSRVDTDMFLNNQIEGTKSADGLLGFDWFSQGIKISTGAGDANNNFIDTMGSSYNGLPGYGEFIQFKQNGGFESYSAFRGFTNEYGDTLNDLWFSQFDATVAGYEAFATLLTYLTLKNDVREEMTMRVSLEDAVSTEISSEISRAQAAESSLEVALSTEVSYLISNTDLTAIDSFAEVSNAIEHTYFQQLPLWYDEANPLPNTTFYPGDLHVVNEINGVNDVFVTQAPIKVLSESIYLNGLLLTRGKDYVIGNNVFIGSYGVLGGVNGFAFKLISTPQPGDTITIYGVYDNRMLP